MNLFVEILIYTEMSYLSLTEAPETNNIFSPMDLSPGQTAYFKCLNSSSMSPNLDQYKIQWFKDNDPLDIDSSRMHLFSSGALEIDELTASDKGNYYCNVTSGSLNK